MLLVSNGRLSRSFSEGKTRGEEDEEVWSSSSVGCYHSYRRSLSGCVYHCSPHALQRTLLRRALRGLVNSAPRTSPQGASARRPNSQNLAKDLLDEMSNAAGRLGSLA